VSEPETIEGHVVEEFDNLPAVMPTSSLLLHGGSARSQVAHAQEIASVLADVIDKQQLYSLIRDKKYVKVEGWQMLGSLLGVFPVTEWTRKTEDGWEARVVAKTLMGAEVGAAEALCSRQERRWATADEYAIRSMAQTRAVSKALRMPLGFVMTLAGYEATPEEEIPRDAAPATSVGGPKPPDVSSWPKITKAISQYDEATHDTFFQFAAAARRLLFGTDDPKELDKHGKAELLVISGKALLALYNGHDPATFPPPSVAEQRAAWASVLEGQELAIPGDGDGN
jgi:hypothetical protein